MKDDPYKKVAESFLGAQNKPSHPHNDFPSLDVLELHMVADGFPGVKREQSAQWVLNTIVSGIRRQGEPAYAKGSCMYRTNVVTATVEKGDQVPEGTALTKVLKCAAGQLIPDSMYSSQFESRPINDIGLDRVWSTIGVHRHLKLIGALQRIHDDNANLHVGNNDMFLKSFNIGAEAVAVASGLTPN